MKVLFPVPSLYPAQNGGPDNTVYWILKALARVGIATTTIATTWGLPDGTRRDAWLDTDHGRVRFNSELHPLLPFRTLAQSVTSLGETDVVHLTMLTFPGSWLLAAANALTYKKPVVWSVRGELDPPMLLRSPRKKQAVLALIRWVLRRSPVTFHSTCAAETGHIRATFGASARVVEVTNYMELPRALKRWPPDPYLLFIGRIDKKKGIDNLLRACAQSTGFMASDWTLRIVGEDDNRYGRELHALAKSLGLEGRVRFLGHRTGPEKQELLAGARAVVMPSHTENFGVVIVEGLSQGTPGIASTGTPWRVLEEYDAGYWLPNDPASIAAGLDRYIGLGDARAREMSRNALRLAKEEFDIHDHVREWEEVYAALI